MSCGRSPLGWTRSPPTGQPSGPFTHVAPRKARNCVARRQSVPDARGAEALAEPAPRGHRRTGSCGGAAPGGRFPGLPPCDLSWTNGLETRGLRPSRNPAHAQPGCCQRRRLASEARLGSRGSPIRLSPHRCPPAQAGEAQQTCPVLCRRASFSLERVPFTRQRVTRPESGSGTAR